MTESIKRLCERYVKRVSRNIWVEVGRNLYDGNSASRISNCVDLIVTDTGIGCVGCREH